MYRRLTLLLLLFLVLFILPCFQTKALSSFDGHSLKRNILKNAHTTSSGIIDIKKDAYNTFYVDAELSEAERAAEGSGLARMMISISHNETILAEDCLNFNDYGRSSTSNCNKLESTDFPCLQTDVQHDQCHLSLDSHYWSLVDTVESCSAGPFTLGSGISGVLGLGLGNGSKANFANGDGDDAIFSIFLDSDLKGGKLLFKKDTDTYAKSSSPLSSFAANSTWQIDSNGASISFEDGDSAASLDGNIMFDFNFDAIGLPPGHFSAFMDLLFYSGSLRASCDSSGLSRTICFSYEDIGDYADLVIRLNGSDIKIPSQIYTTVINETEGGKYFYINVKEISPSLSGENYVSPSFAGSTILGAPFMSYYYTVFDATGSSPKIEMYLSTDVKQKNFDLFLLISIGGSLIVLLGFCFYYCCSSKKGSMRTDSPLLEDEQKAGLSNDS